MTASSDRLQSSETVRDVEDAGETKATARPRARISWMALTILLSNIGLGALALVGCLQFGSIPSALGFLRGDRLIPDAYSKSFGTAQAGQTRTVEFRLTNYLARPVTIIGCRSSCTCAQASDLPIVVPPSATAPFKVKFRAKANKALSSSGYQVSESVRLYTDEPQLKEPVLRVTGCLSE